MGIFKKSLRKSVLDNTYLTTLGFEYGKRSGAQGEEGYTKTIAHNEDEVLWITVNLQKKKVYLYNEWDCGGELWSATYDIPESILNSESIYENRIRFIDWLDKITDY